MKTLRGFLFFAFVFFQFPLLGQSYERGTSKDSSIKSIYINEVYIYNSETDPINYKNKRPSREWIEIYNSTFAAVRTREYYFTDDLNDPLKWNIRVRKRKYKKIKKNGFLPVYINSSGRRKDAKIDYRSSESSPLYLVWYNYSDTLVMDTLYLPDHKRYPYSRYPDGQEYTTINALTPGYGNGFLKETDCRKIIGLNAQLGKTTSSSPQFQNSTVPALAGAVGAYFTKTYPHFSTEYGFRYAVRGYGISYDTSYSTSKGIREISTTGRQTTHHLDFSYYLSNYLIQNISLYYGAVLSIRTQSILKYDQNIDFTFFSTGQKTTSSTSYDFREYNTALDIIDLSFVVGLRYHYKDLFNVSICYTHDVTGLNSNSFTSYGNQRSSGFFIGTEVPILRSMIRVKNTLWLKKIKGAIF